MNEYASSKAGEYVFVPARSIDDRVLTDFAADVWPKHPERILSSWWRGAETRCAIAAVHQATGAMSGICAGLPNPWIFANKTYQGIAISTWYVSPRHAGKGIGKRLVQQFESPDVFMYAFSISHAAAANFAKLGWLGPHVSFLMVLPLPRLAAIPFSLLSQSSLDLYEHAVDGEALPPFLGTELDDIEARRGRAMAHMRRGADDWSRHLSIAGARAYRFCVARRGGTPVGYIVVRPSTPGKSNQLGKLKAAMVTDLAVVNDDPRVMRALAVKAITMASDMRANILLIATTDLGHRKVLSKLGFLSPATPALGRFLERRAPQFMWVPRGMASTLGPSNMALTFADSDVDFNL
jgi:GNAT superfamily N-acetyltransferase